MTGLPPSALERRWREIAPPEELDSARAIYELMPLQSNRQLPLVDVPYDAMREGHWAEAARVADYVAHLPEGGTRVVDFGPGDGWPALPVAAALPGVEVIGVDPSPRRTAVCRANARRLGLVNASFLTGDGGCLPLAGGSVDLVTAASSLEETSDPLAVFSELRRVLRPGGVLRASYQDWKLPTPEFETVALTEGVGCLLYSYARRVQAPAIERRYTLVLPSEGAAAKLHSEALIASADAPRAYGETLLEAGSPLGAPLLERLAPLAERSLTVELRRWTTGWLVEALRAAGFAEVRSTVHAGDLARRFARQLIARGEMPSFAPLFEPATQALGVAAAGQPGDGMVTAVR